MGIKFLSRLFSRSTKTQPEPTRASACRMESLENRELMTLTVTNITADTRGQLLINLSGDAIPSSVHRTSVQVYTEGPDHTIYTADDQFVPAAIRYDAGIRRITINAVIPHGITYRVKLVSSRLRELGTDAYLDGEYRGTFPTGNGVAGGNTEFSIRNDTAATSQYVRMSTSLGVMTLQVLKAQKPNIATHFLSHVNSGDYDSIFFTRSVPGFIIQGGSLKIDANNNVVQPSPGPTVANEFATNGVISNTRGTIALARSTVNDATNQFFFNLGNNSGLDSSPSAGNGFTVFARVANASSLTVMDAIAGKDTVALHNPVTGNGVLPSMIPTGLTDVPVNDESIYTGFGSDEIVSTNPFAINFVVTGNFNARRDTIQIFRTATLGKIGQLTP